jgi:hypothetical protein
MKLTKMDREAFIRAVMDDVPEIDYREKARSAIQKKAIELLPPKLKAIHKEFGNWIKTDRLWNTPGDLGTVIVVSNDDAVTIQQMNQDTEFCQSIEQMAKSLEEQEKSRSDLRSKLSSSICSCTTVKQAHERLPEFVKYLPSMDEKQDRTLPVVANLMEDLAAAGWPKEKKRRILR